MGTITEQRTTTATHHEQVLPSQKPSTPAVAQLIEPPPPIIENVSTPPNNQTIASNQTGTSQTGVTNQIQHAIANQQHQHQSMPTPGIALYQQPPPSVPPPATNAPN